MLHCGDDKFVASRLFIPTHLRYRAPLLKCGISYGAKNLQWLTGRCTAALHAPHVKICAHTRPLIFRPTWGTIVLLGEPGHYRFLLQNVSSSESCFGPSLSSTQFFSDPDLLIRLNLSVLLRIMHFPGGQMFLSGLGKLYSFNH